MTSITSSGRRHQWRQFFDRAMKGLILLSVLVAVIPLALIVGDVVLRGAPAISLNFFVQTPPSPSPCQTCALTGGIANGIVGSFLMVGLGALIAVPVGVGAGIYFSEWPESRLSFLSSFMNDVLAGSPTIILGLFIYILVVVPTRTFSALAGAVALAIVMLPIVARTTEESLKLVPVTLREASMALGVPRWKTVFRVVISTGKAGLATGILLAIARAAGETAPLIFTAFVSNYIPSGLFEATGSLTAIIYFEGITDYHNLETLAWGTALVLVAFMLVLNLSVKFYIGRKYAGVRAEI